MIGAPPEQLSPDGLWRWDGARWIPLQPAPSIGQAPPPAAGARRSAFTIGGGITSIAGAIVLGVGCAIPYVHYTGESASGGPSDWPSVFNPGFIGGWGDVVEPALVIAAVITGAVLAMAWRDRAARAVVAGAIAIMGVQTIAMFAGYVAAGASYGTLQAGAIVGPVGALIVFVGGAMLAGSVLTTERS